MRAIDVFQIAASQVHAIDRRIVDAAIGGLRALLVERLRQARSALTIDPGAAADFGPVTIVIADLNANNKPALNIARDVRDAISQVGDQIRGHGAGDPPGYRPGGGLALIPGGDDQTNRTANDPSGGKNAPSPTGTLPSDDTKVPPDDPNKSAEQIHQEGEDLLTWIDENWKPPTGYDPEGDFPELPAALRGFVRIPGIGPASDDPDANYGAPGSSPRGGAGVPIVRSPRGPYSLPSPDGDGSPSGSRSGRGRAPVRNPFGPYTPNPEGTGPGGPAATRARPAASLEPFYALALALVGRVAS